MDKPTKALICRRRAAMMLAMSLALALFPGGKPAAKAVTPKGPVILTIGGDIAHANRPPVDHGREGIFKYHEITFKRAFAFDRAMLGVYAQKEIIAQPPQLEAPGTFRGPLLRDVLKDIGAGDKSIRTVSLDGFGVEIDAARIAARDWILATSVNGKPLGLGAQGPVWLMHTPSKLVVPEEEERGWPWAVFYIEVKK